MDTLRLSPRIKIPIPPHSHWVITGTIALISFLVWLLIWWIIDLWQLATWPRWQLEQGGGIEPHKLLKLAIFGLVMLACLGAFIAWAIKYHFGFVEWFPPVFVIGFLYAVATGIRL